MTRTLIVTSLLGAMSVGAPAEKGMMSRTIRMTLTIRI